MKSFWGSKPFSSLRGSNGIRISSPYGSERKAEEGILSYSDDRSDTSSYVDLIRANVIKKSGSDRRVRQDFPKWYGQDHVPNASSSWISRWPRATYAFIVTTVLIIGVLVALLIYTNVHLRSKSSSADLPKATHMRNLVTSWSKPQSRREEQSQYPKDFSKYVTPIPCHSHNDYEHKIPLYEALAAGCTGIEADVWLKDNDLLVGHTKDSTSSTRSLKSLYIDPLVSILTHENPSSSKDAKANGVFETKPDASVTLLIDFKSDGEDTLPVVYQALEPLRSKGWLTHIDGDNVAPGPVTVVGTGNTPFDALTSNTTYKDIFFDAPLDKLDGKYITKNSYYASVSFEKDIGKVSNEKLSDKQLDKIMKQVGEAKDWGLKARYWDTPKRPTSVRDYIWDELEKAGVGMLNADDLTAVSRRAW